MSQVGYSGIVTFGGDDLGWLQGITHAGLEAADVDMTTLLSPNRAAEFSRGLTDPGRITGTQLWDGSGLLLKSLYEHKDPANINVRFADNSQFYGSGFVGSVTFGASSPNDPVTQELEFELTGPVGVVLGG